MGLASPNLRAFADEKREPGEVLLEDTFSRGNPGASPETLGWTLDNKRGNSRRVLAKDGVCRVHHVTKEYANDSLSREVNLPSRYYLDFEARFQEHAGLSFVAAAGRSGASFAGQGKVVLWKVLPNRKQGFAWQTVPKTISVGTWHRFRILVDIDEKVQQFYIDDMAKPAFREEGRDLRLQSDSKQPAAKYVEFRDYGLVQQPTVTEFRKVRLVALKHGEMPPADSFTPSAIETAIGPTPAQLWQRPGRAKRTKPKQPVVIGSDVELFVDDYLIDTAENTRRRLNKPHPHPDNPVLIGDRPWENGMVIFPSVRWIDGKFHMWYLGWGMVWPSREGKASIADSSFLCYATSNDGVHWTRPKLGHIEYRGSRDNNIVLRHEGSHFDSFSVFHHQGQDYPFRMLAYQGRWPYREPLIKAKGYEFRIKDHGHFPFRSKDGIRWEYMQSEPKPVCGFDRSSASYDARRGKYLGFWKTMHKGVRSRMYAESDDLVHWTTPQKSLTPEWVDNPASQVDPAGTHHYGMFAFNYGNQYLGLLEILNDLTNSMHFQLISSRDLKTWNRLSAPERFIAHGKPDSWNSGVMMMANTPPVLFQDKLWFYYDGQNYGHGGGRKAADRRRSIGVSTLPRDRFAALLPDDKSQDAVVTTVPLKLHGKQIHVNAAAPNGMVQIEILDAKGQVIPGFSREDCKALVAGDSLSAPLTFKSGKPLPAGIVRLRFILFEAELFAFHAK